MAWQGLECTCGGLLVDNGAGDVDGLGVQEGRGGDGVEADLQALHDGPKERACIEHTQDHTLDTVTFTVQPHDVAVW